MNAHTPPSDQIWFPEKLQCLFSPKRYIVLYGGRGAGRSWGVARKTLLQGVSQSVTVLCARELQKSIDESVHKTLRTQIEVLGLQDDYDVQRDKIYSNRTATEFSFIGVKNDPNKVRSYEGIDICWVEEAHKVSQDSWKVLIPTIRKKGSQIIITFNVDLDTDYTFVRFVKELLPKAKPVICEDRDSPLFGQILWHETDNAVICKMTYEDNPWFFTDTELVSDMEADRERDEDTWLNIWKGFPRQNLDGAVFAKELRKAQMDGRITAVPYDREYPVDTFWDLGFFDQTVVWFAQRVAAQWRVLDCLIVKQTELSAIIKMMQAKPFAYGQHFLPHDAKAKKLGMRHTIEEQLRRAFPGRVPPPLPVCSVADGNNAVREMFPQCWFNEATCAEGLQSLRHYRYKVIDGQLSAKPLHDPASDIADAFRTMAMARREPRGDDAKGILERLRRPVQPIGDALANSLSWLNS